LRLLIFETTLTIRITTYLIELLVICGAVAIEVSVRKKSPYHANLCEWHSSRGSHK